MVWSGRWVRVAVVVAACSGCSRTAGHDGDGAGDETGGTGDTDGTATGDEPPEAEAPPDFAELAYVRSTRSPTGDSSTVTILASADGRHSAPLPPGSSGLEWAPDGSSYAFRLPNPNGIAGGVNVINVDDLSPWAVSPLHEVPRWSPTGSASLVVEGRGDRLVYLLADSRGTELRSPSPEEEALTGQWSPDGESLAFVGDSIQGQPGLRVLELSSGRVRRLTGDLHVGGHRWSPSGDLIAFESMSDRRLFVQDAEGGDPFLVADVDVGDSRFATWSLDDAWLAFQDAEDQVRVVPVDPDAAEDPVVLATANTRPILRWSPDGLLGWESEDGQVVVADPRAGAVTTAMVDRPIQAFEWDRDGDALVILTEDTDDDDFDRDIWVAEGDGSNATMIPESEGSVDLFSWSPRRDRLAFAAEDVLYVASLPDVTVRRLGSLRPTPSSPPTLEWSPDGNRIAKTTFGFFDCTTLCESFDAIDPDTGETQTLGGITFMWGPIPIAWSPTGSRVAFLGAEQGNNPYTVPQQIRVFDFETGSAVNLTPPQDDDPEYHFSAISWRPSVR